ncbi:hypothetical protein [Nocardiopsis sp. B62]|uniref:hypothetical protein n=1 Tax=Nocardiopsis sp. B62 TaxID=2824874 RepID=UPI001B3595BE|nr:hypothetical protein [Nocardiopsis sp. B62]MBQ1081592.1 hypothetical protein [Nocardiopsis sp. B62]
MTNTANTPAETKAAPKAKAENPCQCARFSNAETGEATGCTKTTTREFSPGHDAKLKSLALRAGAAGQQVTRMDDGIAVTTDAVKAVEGYGFAHMVASGIERAQAKARAKAERAAARAAAKEKGTDSSDTVRAKVGRVTYEGRLESSEFVYTVNGAERRTTKHQLV